LKILFLFYFYFIFSLLDHFLIKKFETLNLG